MLSRSLSLSRFWVLRHWLPVMVNHGGGSLHEQSLKTNSARERRKSPVLGFEPRSEAPQASRIIQCSGTGGSPPGP